MAWSLVQEAHSFAYVASGNPSITTPQAVVAGNLLVVFCTSTTNNFLMPSDGRNRWIPLNVTPLAGGYGFLQAFWAIAESSRVLNVSFFGSNPTGGTGVYYQATPVTLASAGMQFMEWSNPAGIATSVQTIGTATGTSTAPAATINPTSSSLLVLGFACPDTTADTLTPAAGWTAAAPGVNASAIYKTEVAAGSVTPTFVQGNSATWSCIAGAFIPASQVVTGTISGSLGALGAKATVKFIDAYSSTVYTVQADGAGNYISPTLNGSRYVVQPQLVGVVFSPNNLTEVLAQGSNTGNNFTPTQISTSLTLIQTVADSMQRANENPLSNGGTWAVDGTPVPPFDAALQLVSNEAIGLPSAAVANFLGPFAANGGMVWVGGSIPSSQYATIQIDQLSSVASTYASFILAAKSDSNNTHGYYLTGWNNGNGTMNLGVVSIGVGGTNPVNPNSFTFHNLSNGPIFQSAYQLWTGTIPFTLGDRITLACIGNSIYILHNGSIVGNFQDATVGIPIGSFPTFYCCYTNITDTQISHFSSGTAFVTNTYVSDVVDTGTLGTSQATLTTEGFNVAQGDLIVVFIGYFQNTGQTISSVTDTAGNTYNLAGTVTANTLVTACYYAQNCAAQVGNAVKATFSAGVTFADVIAYHVPAGKAVAFDNFQSATGTTVTSLTPSISTSGPYEIIFAYSYASPAGTTIAFPSASWSQAGMGPGISTGQSGFTNSAYQVFPTQQSSLGVKNTFSASCSANSVLAAFSVNPRSLSSGSGDLDFKFRYNFGS